MAVEISIVMPVRNATGTLPAALESICGQTFENWELFAIDDGSTDGTGAILKEWQRRDERIRILTQASLGIVQALQRGCGEACARYVARMDADDLMHPERLEKQHRYLESHPETGLVSCRVHYGGNRSAQAGYAAHVDWINTLVDPETIALRRFVESPVSHPSVMFRRELLERWGEYRAGDFPEDYELWLRWMDAGVQFGKINEGLFTWNDPGHRLSRRDPRYRIEAFYRMKCFYLARWLRKHVSSSRAVWLWGAGRSTRKRFLPLEQEGIRLAGFIDIDMKKRGRLSDGRPAVLPGESPSKEEAFIVSGVSSRGARDEISAYLVENGRVEGTDFLLAA